MTHLLLATYPNTTSPYSLVGSFFSFLTTAASFYFLSIIFKKMGIESWKAWVPVYNIWVFLKAGGQKGYYIFLPFMLFIPYVGWIGVVAFYVLLVIASYNIAKEFQKTGAMAFLFIIIFLFFFLLWCILLAYSSMPLGNRFVNLSENKEHQATQGMRPAFTPPSVGGFGVQPLPRNNTGQTNGSGYGGLPPLPRQNSTPPQTKGYKSSSTFIEPLAPKVPPVSPQREVPQVQPQDKPQGSPPIL